MWSKYYLTAQAKGGSLTSNLASSTDPYLASHQLTPSQLQNVHYLVLLSSPGRIKGRCCQAPCG